MINKGLQYVTFTADAFLIVLVALWDLNAPSKFGLNFYVIQFLSATLGLILLLIFLRHARDPEKSSTARIVSTIAGIIGLGCCWYISIRYPALVNQLVFKPLDGVLIGAATVLLVLEATRRAAGKALTLVIIGLSLYALLGHFLPGVYATRPVSLSRLAVYLGMDTNALFGIPIKVAVVIVVPFVIMGGILSDCGGGDFFSDLATATMGRYRGGAAKIAIFGSALFGMISGSAVANVAGVGNVTIPLMTRSGFNPKLAASIEAVGSTGGQLMPPIMGAAAFLIAEFLQVPYTAVLAAALIPAFMYYASLFMQVDLEAVKNNIGGAPLSELPRVKEVLKEGWHFPIPFIVLVVGLVFWNVQVEYAALVVSGILLFFSMSAGYKGKRLNIKQAVKTVVSAGSASADIIVICAAAGLVIGVLNITGLAFSLALELLAITSGHLLFLLVVTGIISIILGMGMPTAGVYVILAVLAAPALEKAGLTPMQANLFVMYFGMMSMITPPVALAAYTAATISGSDTWSTGWISVRVGWCAYVVPLLFALSPALLLDGTPQTITLTTISALLGVYIGSAAVVGYMATRLTVLARIVLSFIAVGLLIPTNTFEGALILNIVAGVIGCLFIAREVHKGRMARKA